MPTITEKIALAREKRAKADQDFRDALLRGKEGGMSWSQLAEVSGLSESGVRYLALDLNKRRVERRAAERVAA